MQRSDGSECVHGYNEYQETYWKSKKPWLDPLVLGSKGLPKYSAYSLDMGSPNPRPPILYWVQDSAPQAGFVSDVPENVLLSWWLIVV